MKNKLIIPLLLVLLLTSCGPTTPTSESLDSESVDTTPATEIVIYAGGSAEYSWRKGALEEEVYRAVEAKYYLPKKAAAAKSAWLKPDASTVLTE